MKIRRRRVDVEPVQTLLFDARRVGEVRWGLQQAGGICSPNDTGV